MHSPTSDTYTLSLHDALPIFIIGRNEDDKPNCAKHLAFHEEKYIPNNHFKSNLNKFEMDLPTHRYAYSSTPNWSDKKGVYEESGDRKSTRLNSSHVSISYAVF